MVSKFHKTLQLWMNEHYLGWLDTGEFIGGILIILGIIYAYRVQYVDRKANDEEFDRWPKRTSKAEQARETKRGENPGDE